MFAVPGWSVSSDALKKETAPAPAGASNSKATKRKRGAAGAQPDEKVTAANVADLWETVVEGKSKAESTAAGSVNKKRKNKNKDKKSKEGQGAAEPTQEAAAEDETVQSSTKKQKKSKQDKSHKASEVSGSATQGSTSVPENVVPKPPTPTKLTPLQASMRDKLISARFRHLNETLYTRPSEEAFELFSDSPEMFSEYHEGFRRQVKVWPENPVDSFLHDIRTRAAIRAPDRKRGGAPPSRPLRSTHLPRTTGTCTIADLGCGDARLAESLQQDRAKLRLDVKSFDLQSPSSLVTKADIANLPLPDESVNVAIFCLALMGTNWLDFIEEAHRILHWRGELWVAEIKSRFAPQRKGKVVTHSVGHRKKGKGAGPSDDADNRQDDLLVEVDGADDRRKETDVTAFVEALRKRGFVPNGQKSEAVDLSNKMFVKMRFTKGATPIKGKGAAKTEEPPKMIRGARASLNWPNGKDENDAEKDEVDESGILKACLYKIR